MTDLFNQIKSMVKAYDKELLKKYSEDKTTEHIKRTFEEDAKDV